LSRSSPEIVDAGQSPLRPRIRFSRIEVLQAALLHHLAALLHHLTVIGEAINQLSPEV
jgi:hypothetical protein